MSQNYVQPGDHITIAASPVAVESGQMVIASKLAGVASGNAEIGEEVVIAVTGVFEITKTVGNVFALGADVYYDSTVHAATSGAAGTDRIGVCVEPASSADTTVKVRLVPA